MKCPICNQETAWKDNPYRPFCSERCKTIDLGRWAGGDYRIEGPPKSDFEQVSDAALETKPNNGDQ